MESKPASSRDPIQFVDPNRYAPAPRLELRSDSATLYGYQTFLVTRETVDALADDPLLRRKQELLKDYFRPCYLEGKSFLDLGANAGFFCFWALQEGASRAVALDLDRRYLDMAEQVAVRLAVAGLETANANVVDWTEPCDVVVAFALIHWIYSCTAFFGSLDAAVKKLADVTRSLLLVEWVAPDDEAIQFFRHLDWNAALPRGPYTRAAFEAALKRHFARYEVLGEVSPTRRLYLAFSAANWAHTPCPLPVIWPEERVVSQRLLTVFGGKEYWSRVYDLTDVVYKQATDDLAEREFQFLSRLDGAHFPRALHASAESGYSVVALEKIRGVPLQDAKTELASSVDTLHACFQHCLTLLSELGASGIAHRDIRLANMFVRESRPVLIDFGWATSENLPYPAPANLGREGRPPDGSFSDVYSMGKVFGELSDRRYPVFDEVIALMTDPDPRLRVVDVPILETLFAAAAMCEAETTRTATGGQIELPVDPSKHAAGIRELLAQVSRRNERLRRKIHETWSESVRMAIGEIVGVIPAGSLLILVDEDQWGVQGMLPERRCVPFLERDGLYWGPPPDDATAVAELERLRRSGATFVVFAWSAFWWLEYYSGLHAHLRATSRCVLQNDRVVVFDLRESAAPDQGTLEGTSTRGARVQGNR